MRRLMLVTLLGLLAIGALGGCSNAPTGNSMGTMNVQLSDAPGDFQSVNLVVRQVAVKVANASDDDRNWEVLSSQVRTFDLLQLRNGVFGTLGLSPLPAGRYEQLRLKLSSGSTVVVDGVTHPLRVASGDQSGLKLIGAFTVPKNGRIDLVLDFDVARSFHRNRDGSYTMRPRIRCVCVNLPDHSPATIRGAVMPADAQASVYLLSNADTLASAMADNQGNFQMGLLSAGSYQLAFHSDHGYVDQTMSNVVLAWGQVKDVGTVQLAPAPPPPPPPAPTAGTISGMVSPLVAASVSVMQSSSAVETLSVDIEGRFLAVDLPAGSYDVLIHPLAGFQDASRPGISVVAGANSDLGVIALTPIGPPPPPPPPPPGAITGSVAPSGLPTTVTLMLNGNVIATTDVAMDGSFSFSGVAPGTYDVMFHPAFDYPDSTVSGVVVNSGATTDMGVHPL